MSILKTQQGFLLLPVTKAYFVIELFSKLIKICFPDGENIFLGHKVFKAALKNSWVIRNKSLQFW